MKHQSSRANTIPKQRKLRKKRRKRKPNGTSYYTRNQILKSMGFADYSEYLKSDLWSSIRSRVYREKGHRCVLCGSRAKLVHHNKYGRSELNGKNIKHLHPLCNTCHKAIETSETGVKLELEAVRRNFDRVKQIMDDG
jgi:hypothetical protein